MSELVLAGMVIGIGIIVAAFIAKDASRRGRSEIGWFIGVFLALIVFLPLYLIVRKPLLPKVIEQEQLESGNSRKCPFCAEIIKSEAHVCRFCGRGLAATNDSGRSLKVAGQIEQSQGVCATCGEQIHNSHEICVHCAARSLT